MDRGSDPTAGIGRRALSTHREHRSLTTGFDQLVGRGRWVERSGLGTFPIRFPNLPESDDTGWHCDGSFRRVALPVEPTITRESTADAVPVLRSWGGRRANSDPGWVSPWRECRSSNWPISWEAPSNAQSLTQLARREMSISVTHSSWMLPRRIGHRAASLRSPVWSSSETLRLIVRDMCISRSKQRYGWDSESNRGVPRRRERGGDRVSRDGTLAGGRAE